MPLLLAVTLALAPWAGPSLPTASPAAAKYKLTVHGAASSRVELNAGGLPAGWVASFCTKTLCSPFRYTMQLDTHGAGTIEFQAIRTADNAPRHIRISITASTAKPITLSL